MNALLIWFMLANLGLAALWIFYRILLHRDTLFTGKRFILLVGLFAAMIYPLLNVADWMSAIQPVQKITQNFSILLPEITVSVNATKPFSTFELITNIYVAVAILLFCRVLFQFVKLVILAKRHQSLTVDDQKVVCLPSGTAPFSFFNLIFIQPEDHSQSDLHEILQHERSHVRQAHTFDVIVAEIVCTLFWINPFAWLLKYDIRENLEFIADKDVVHAGIDPKSYQYHLLRLSYQQSPIRMGNKFNVSQLQNRIKMMNKKRTSQVGWGKYLLTLPLFAALLLVSYACRIKSEKDTKPLAAVESIKNDSASDVDTSDAPPLAPPLKKTIKFTPPKATSTPTLVKKTVKFVAPTVKDTTYDGVDQMPMFPGGDLELMKFIRENLKYPSIAAATGIEGRVTIRFIVDRNGAVSDVTVLRGLDAACDNEAVRVVKLMPRWIPGRMDGRNVSVYYTLPVVYKLKK